MAIYTGSSKHLGGAESVQPKETVFYGLIRKNVLVTGGNGQLGRELHRLTEKTDTPFHFIFTDVDTLDITNEQQVTDFVEENAIEYIVNCAAYTAVDKAETDADAAYRINCLGAQHLAGSGAKIIHISTDYVFDGTASEPYREDAPAKPESVYGKTKLAGEDMILSIAKEWIILRTSWLYSEFGNNFVKTMLRLMEQRNEIEVVTDQHGTPTYAADLAEMILTILEADEWKTGIYHFSNLGETTWFLFARRIRALSDNVRTQINPILTSEYKTDAPRPLYSVMDKSKIQDTFNVVIPDWEDGLIRCLKRLGVKKK